MNLLLGATMSKLILVANRLPVTVEKTENGLIYKQSVGGLATGMSSLSAKFDCYWIGFPGITSESVNEKEMKEITQVLKTKYQCIPVFLSNTDVSEYYEGFSNETLWPLFHYFPNYTKFNSLHWDTYHKVNLLFLKNVQDTYMTGDYVWIQDYHFLLLPMMLRNVEPNAMIGFFLHIPFPTYEVFRLLPWRKAILEGLLGADLIGFHTSSYVRHFLDNVHHLLGYEDVFDVIRFSERKVKVSAFPMGIDYRKFESVSKIPEFKSYLKELKKNTDGYKIILSVDRLDYSKGITERLESFQVFLEKHAEFLKKVIWIIVAVPSRTNVTAYGDLHSKVNELVGKINGRYETVGWTPIHYLTRSIDFPELCALYYLADVALVTPLRDGMNLVAKEYVAVKHDLDGVLILSEMAGVSEELGEALTVNPHSNDEISSAIITALKMPVNEKKQRMRIMRERLLNKDVFKWAGNFMEDLQNLETTKNKPSARFIDMKWIKEISAYYKKSKNRVIFLDYDGTLVPFKKKPQGLTFVPKASDFIFDLVKKLNVFEVIKDFSDDIELNDILLQLERDNENKLVIISGRNRRFLEEKFGKRKFFLIAEHGAWIRKPGAQWEKPIDLDSRWKEHLRPLFQLYLDRTPGSYIEEKDFSLVWHYRMVHPSIAESRMRELKRTILNTISNMSLKVLEGNKVLEVKNVEIDKGRAAKKILAETGSSFIIAIGDDMTDEDLFEALPEGAITIKVGNEPTYAGSRVHDYTEVRKILSAFYQN